MTTDAVGLCWSRRRLHHSQLRSGVRGHRPKRAPFLPPVAACLARRRRLLPRHGASGALAASSYEQSPWTLLYFPLFVWIIYKGFSLLLTCETTPTRRLSFWPTRSTSATPTPTSTLSGGRLREPHHRPPRPPADDVELIVSAAHVHDLGKIAIDNRILFKEGPLTTKSANRSTPIQQQERSWPASSACTGRVRTSSATTMNAGTAPATPTALSANQSLWEPDHRRGRCLRRHDIGQPYRRALSHEVA